MKHLTLLSMLVLGLLIPGYGQDEDKERIESRFYQEWLMTHDPATGTIPRDRLLDAARIAQERRRNSHLRSGLIPIYWHERGPSNVGGRTRALLIDANDPSGKKVWAGSVSGGLWRTDDIDAATPTWVNIDDYFSNLAVTALAQSPLNPNLIFFGTGEEGIQPNGGVRGMGVWRTTNGGISWQQLPFVNNSFSAINKIVIDNAGLVYVATSTGLFRSTDANGTFSAVALPVLAGNVQDLEKAADGTLYASVNSQGIFKLSGNTWNQVMSGNFPTSSIGRVEIATAPGNANTLYAAFSRSTKDTCLSVLVSIDAGVNWTARTCPAGMGDICWYAFIMAVDPNNANRVWIGSDNLYQSADGGNTWALVMGVHADHHAIAYQAGNSDQVVFGNDGGVYRSLNASASSPTLTAKNNGYNVTQFYSAALHPKASSNFILGGTQDNGTQRFDCAGVCETTSPTGGDGGFCFVDTNNTKLQITSSQNRRFYLTTDSFATSIDLLPDKEAALFITPADFDDANNILYFSDAKDTLGRVVDVGGANTVSYERITQLNGREISHVKLSPNTAHRIFVGTTKGRMFRIDNANQSGGISVTQLDSVFSTYVSCIEVEAGDDNHLLVTTSSYGKTSIFESKDGGNKWTQVEGDLPDMPVRWVMFHPFDSTQALIATELGVWTTDQLNGSKTEWFPTNTFGLANVRVDMLQYRPSDHLVVAASHGRGMYSTDYFNLLTTSCPPNLMLSGTTPSGLYLAKDFIESDATIAKSSSVIYQAGNFIRLKPEFHAEAGSFFVATIQDCEMNLKEAPSISSRPPDDLRPMMRCFPNPVSYRMSVQVSLPIESWYNLQVRSLDGRLVNTLTSGNRTAIGEQWHELNTSDFKPGIYLLMLQSANGATTEKFVVVK